jgi:hypothetical protein
MKEFDKTRKYGVYTRKQLNTSPYAPRDERSSSGFIITPTWHYRKPDADVQRILVHFEDTESGHDPKEWLATTLEVSTLGIAFLKERDWGHPNGIVFDGKPGNGAMTDFDFGHIGVRYGIEYRDEELYRLRLDVHDRIRESLLVIEYDASENSWQCMTAKYLVIHDKKKAKAMI